MDGDDPKSWADAATSGLEVISSLGSFVDRVVGDGLREYGQTFADYARLRRWRNLLAILDEVEREAERRGIAGKPTPIPEALLLPLLDGASLEGKPEVRKLWAGLISNTIDPESRHSATKVFVEILRGMEPIDARILAYLAEPGVDERFSVLSPANLNAAHLSAELSLAEADVALSLSNLARFGCVIDAWQNTMDNIDTGYAGFRVSNPGSNFRLSYLGRALVDATSAT